MKHDTEIGPMNTNSLPLGNPKLTLELLWKRIRQRGDLPGFSKVIGAILGAMRGEDDREFNMTKTVLDDPALTQRVLRLANSAMYSVFGQGINTVSKAVIVLGTESIGHLALGLKLIDGLASASSASVAAHAQMEKAVLAGHIARHMASSASTRDAEEAVVCSMLHSLGRMMASFYLTDMWSLVQARCADTGVDQKQAVRDIFGMSLDEMSRAVARQWGLPPVLIESLRDMPPRETDEPLDHAHWLAAMSTMSTCCSAILCGEGGDPNDIPAIVDAYADMLGMERDVILAAIDMARQSARDEAAILPRAEVLTADALPAASDPAATAVALRPADATLILTRGVADMRNLSPGAMISQLATMALETIYQGLGMSRTIAFLRDPARAEYVGRMCFGDDTHKLMPYLTFGDAYRPDVFHAALAHDRMVFVNNAQDPSFNSKLPRWWRDVVPQTVHSFLILPLTINRQPVGFLYGDWDGETAIAGLNPSETVQLDELRALIVKGLEQRRPEKTGWMI